MPNWANNVVELAHADQAMLIRARDAFNRGELLNEFIPVPEELKIVAGRVSDPEEQAKLEADTARNKAKYGYDNWYDFRVGEWSTKWDVGAEGYEVEIENNSLTLSFDSAWAPPIGAYEKLMELGFCVRAYYYEPGMAFCGVWDEGFDDYYEIGDRSWEEVKDEIPEALDEMFGISETMQAYEEEIDEELYNFVTEGAEAKKAASE